MVLELRVERKKKPFILGTCYCKGNYSVKISVFGLVEKELSFENKMG